MCRQTEARIIQCSYRKLFEFRFYAKPQEQVLSDSYFSFHRLRKIDWNPNSTNHKQQEDQKDVVMSLLQKITCAIFLLAAYFECMYETKGMNSELGRPY